MERWPEGTLSEFYLTLLLKFLDFNMTNLWAKRSETCFQ